MPAISEINLDIDENIQGEPAVPDAHNAVKAALLYRCRNILGEGILYDDHSGSVLWTDIMTTRHEH